MAAGLTAPTSGAPGLSAAFVLRLAFFTALYFLLNSGLVTIAISLEQREGPLKIWWANFRELWINFAAGASIAAFAANAKGVNLAFIGVIVPLLVVIYVTYSWSAKRVQAERDKNLELNRVFLSTVEALALAIDAKDQVTHGHIRRVQRYTMGLADALGVKDEKQLDALRAAALLHDTGKLAVPEYILNKPGPLTASEFERMKVHADVGADILKSIDFPYPVEPIVRHHHEAWVGRATAGLKGQDIPLGARILSVVDCYDALTSDRPYRPRMTRLQAEQVLRDGVENRMTPGLSIGFWESDKLEAAEAQEGQQVSIVDRPAAQHCNWMRLRLRRQKSVSSTNCAANFRGRRRWRGNRNSLQTPETGSAAVDLGSAYRPRADANELTVVAACEVPLPFEGTTVPIAERVSGWVFANGQSVLNSDATLELGPVARTFPSPRDTWPLFRSWISR
jgi:putative nucleotidyltransferase with HDIG domain